MAVDIYHGVADRDAVRVRRGWCTVCLQIAERPRPCEKTLQLEAGLGEFALINGLWSTFLPGGYTNGGWSVARLVIPQQWYGVSCIALAAFAAFAYAHGSLRYRKLTCVFGLAIMLVVAPLIALGNPLSPLLPVFAWIARRRFAILGAFIDYEAEQRRAERRVRILRGLGDAP